MNSMGPLLSEYRTGSLRHWVVLIGGPVCILASGWLVFIYDHKDFFSVAIGCGCALFACFATWHAYRLLGNKIYVYDSGIQIQSGENQDFWRWTDIKELYQKKYYYNDIECDHVIWLVTQLGNRVRIDAAYKSLNRLAKQIEDNLTEALLLEARDALNDGRSCNFGDLQLDRIGFMFRNKRLEWSNVKSAGLVSGIFCENIIAIKSVHKNKTWYSKSALSFPNLRFFEILVSRHTITNN